MTAIKANDQDGLAITTAARDYYAVDSCYRPPDMQRATGPSAQRLIQGIVTKWTQTQRASVALAKQCGLMTDVIAAGQNVTSGLSIRWEPDDFLQGMNADIGEVSYLVD
jgi:hypothetical protein